MDEAQSTPQPKISVSEAFILGLAILLLDAIDVLPFAGEITDVPAALLFIYLQKKKVSGLVFAIGWILALIPIVQILPTRFVAWLITIYIDRHPSALSQKLEVAGELAQGAEGGAVGAEAEEATEGAAVAATEEAAGETATATPEISEDGTQVEEGVAEESKPEGVEGDTPREAEEKREEEEPQGLPSEEPEQGEESEEESEDISETESEEDPEKLARRKLLEETPGEGKENEEEHDDDEDDDNSMQPPRPNNVVSGDEFAKRQKELKVKQQLQAPKPAKEATGDRDVDTLKKVA